MPKAVGTMLEALRAGPGMRVLDVGTGTGYTAARLAEIVGPDGFVTSVEVDAQLVGTARANLARAGVENAEVVCADGFEGWPTSAPYDRTHVTCGIRTTSYAWARQSTAGGRIVLPWGTDFTPHDRLLTLIVDEAGTASGRFGVGLSFMKMRAQRLTPPDHAAYAPPGWMESGRDTDSDLELSDVREIVDGDGSFVVGLRVPECVQVPAYGDDGSVTVWLYSTRDRSVAVAAFGEETASNVVQAGARSLWTEVERARTWWVGNGRPRTERLGLTVDADGQRAWLDDPTAEAWPVH
ncbi:methyltransferase domain-containing protein [Embleya sp. AB8]|uniref:methyltransferase domain-containing protein n=1 Tax=Embleya sp. AB8 TaxID=3156304 RepID=UPI003C73F02E